MNINTDIINGKLAHQVKIIEETNEKEASEQANNSSIRLPLAVSPGYVLSLKPFL